MYIEELEIDIYMIKAKQYEDMDEEQQWDAEEPTMTPTVQKYFEAGELFLDEDGDTPESEATDIMSVAPDIFG